MTHDSQKLDAAWAELSKHLRFPDQPSPAISRAVRLAERLAAVKLWFNPVDLWFATASTRRPVAKPDLIWLEHMRLKCTVDSTDAGQWLMLDRERLPLLARLSASGELLDTCQRAATTAADSTPRMLSEILQGQFEPTGSQAETLVTAREVIRWLEAIHSKVRLPDADSLGGLLELKARDVELAHLAHHIVGRETELRTLVSFVRQTWRVSSHDHRLSLFILEGIGGIGKSTLAADFARNHLPKEYDAPITIWIDYDKLRIRPEDIRTVLLEIARQLSWRLPEAAAGLRKARNFIRGSSRVNKDRTIARAAIDTIAEAVHGTRQGRLDQPVLLVLDTFEQVERVPGQTADILGVLDSLRECLFDRFAVLACGRAVFSKGFGDVEVNDRSKALRGLWPGASRHLLTGRGGLGEHAADTFLAAFEDLGDEFPDRVGVPMLLMLIARLIREKHFELEGKDVEAIREAADATMATAYIYGRVLAQVPEDLRALAHPGLVLPEVSVETIKSVLWPAIHGSDYPLSMDRAQSLFDRLSRETWLVEPVAGSVPSRVRHRTDLRRAMLQKMYADPDPKVRCSLIELHTQARNWHKCELDVALPHSSPAAYHQLGYVYHVLQLAAVSGRAARVSLARIRPVRDELAYRIEDFPRGYQPIVRALLGEVIEPTDLLRLDGRLRATLLTDLFRGFAMRNDAQGGLALASKLRVEDRTATPAIARWILRSYLPSGKWRSAARVIAPLVDGPDAAAFDFGNAVPQLRPFLAAAQAFSLPHVLDVLDSASHRARGSAVRERYRMLLALFRHLYQPDIQTRAHLFTLLESFTLAQRPRRATAEALSYVRIYGALLRSDDPGRHELSAFAAAGRRGAHAVGLATLLELDGEVNRPRRTSAQWIAACKAREARLDSERGTFHVKFATVFEDFHSPLGEALASAISDTDQVFHLASQAWDMLDIRPPDLRPSQFSEACTDRRTRRERMRTLVAFMDRAGQLGEFLRFVLHYHGDDADVATVAGFAQQWRWAFEGVE